MKNSLAMRNAPAAGPRKKSVFSRIAKDYTTRHQGATGIIVRTIFN